MSTGTQRRRVGDVELRVTAAGTGPLVVLAHGFPDLAHTWRRQVPALAEAGYRVLAPDMRGYGGSDRPPGPAGYDSASIGADLIGLLDDEDVERAHLVGHDWGAASVWPLGLTHPDRLLSLTGISVPITPPAAAPPTEILRRRLGEDFYMLRFQHADAGAALARDVRGTLLAAFGDRVDLLGTAASLDPPPWLPTEVLEEHVRTFTRTGFEGGLQYYRNLDTNWRQRTAGPITTPSLFVTGTRDPVTGFMPVDRMPQVCTDLRRHTVDGAGHWVHQERPHEVNALLLDHLARADR